MKSLLSIQSHVSHGYVGLRAATFTLQTQGWDVDNINTVNFSNHTGYGQTKGSPISVTECKKLVSGLTDIQVINTYDAVISGYIPNADLIATVVDLVATIKNNSQCLYLLDPVMGDQGHLYVDELCVGEYQKAIRRGIVDIMTPNQFELELITGREIKTKDDLREAVDFLHQCGVKYVVVSSVDGSIPISEEEDVIYCVFSTAGHGMRYISVPIIKSYFTGVGDLLSALLLDKLHRCLGEADTLGLAVNQALTIMSKVLRRTRQLGLQMFCDHHNIPYSEDAITGDMNSSNMKFFELKIIQSAEYFSYSGPGIYKIISI